MLVSTSSKSAGMQYCAWLCILYLVMHVSYSHVLQEEQKGKKVYHLWLREALATALFEKLQNQDKLANGDSLRNYVVYFKQ